MREPNFRSRYGLSATGGNAPALEDCPARLDARQTAKILGFQEHDIAILVLHKLLEPLGSPVPNAKKYFARVDVLQLAENTDWLDDATKTLYKHWQGKNASRKDDKTTLAIAE